MPFKYGVSAQGWYKALGDVGYNFGPHFQKQRKVESVAGKRYSRVRLSFSDPQSPYIQSSYAIHPVCMDSCLQSGVPSLWQGHKSSIDTALVPAIIDDLFIRPYSTKPENVIAISTSEYTGSGNPEKAKSYKTHVSAYEENSGIQIFQMSGLHYNELDTLMDRHESHTYCRIEWRPDVSFLTQKQLLTMFPPQQENATTGYPVSASRMSHFVSLIAHKKPDLAVLEIDMTLSTQSIWLDPSDGDGASRAACRRYIYTSNSVTRLEKVQKNYQKNGLAEFGICSITKPSHEFTFGDAGFDLVIMKLVCAKGELREACQLNSINSLKPPRATSDTP